MKNENKTMDIQDKKNMFSKLKSIIINNIGQFLSSLGIGGFLSLFIIEKVRVNFKLPLEKIKNIYDIYGSNITNLELYILLISILLLIISPILSKNITKTRWKIFVINNLILLEVICFMSVVVHQKITDLFVIGTTLLSIFITWLIIDILRHIKCWFKKDEEEIYDYYELCESEEDQ
ncbi:hypothetical protein [Clostridium sp.]|uniref:hypothetical protein n=1 Tax=Clostridium sp. TaxID=1506 RepID=UPI0025B97808|nr:hypothetical protein [Clostridium sp.]